MLSILPLFCLCPSPVDYLQSLVDDDMVHQERIGASNYFWSFPGEAAAKVAGEIAKLEKRLQVTGGLGVESPLRLRGQGGK